MLLADGHIRRSRTLDVTIQRERFPLKSEEPKFQVRVPPELHRRLALEAAESGVSLNRLASAKLSQ